MYGVKWIGGADLKILLPIIFIIPNLLLFLIIRSAVGVIYSIREYYFNNKSKSIPGFVPITIAFVVSILVS